MGPTPEGVKAMLKQDKFQRPEGMQDAEVVIRPINSPLAKKMGAFLLNSVDLHLASVWFEHASIDGDTEREPISLASRRDAYFHAAVAAYRRCCNSGQRTLHKSRHDEDARITAVHAAKVLSDGAALHKELIELGNRLVAHSTARFETAVVGARCLWKRDEGVHALIDGASMTLKVLTVGKKQLERFGLLCYALETGYLQPEINSMRELLNQEVGAMTPEDLFMRPVFLVTSSDGLVYNPMDPSRQYPRADQLPVENETE